MIERYVAEAKSSHDKWLEDTLESLIECGLRRDQIEVQIHPNNRTVVCIDGKPRFEWTLKVSVQNASV